MPFSVFRQHQKKLLAVFGIMAMISFVLADSLPRFFSPAEGPNGGDPVVARLYGSDVHRSDLAKLAQDRRFANMFVGQIVGNPGLTPFGGYSTRDLVSGLILRHEADRLGLPDSPQVARDWLKQVTNNRMTRELFDVVMAGFADQITGEQALSAISSQVRLTQVPRLMAGTMVTPFDVFRSYRDQSESVSAKVISVATADYLKSIKDPSPAELQAFFDKYKDALPDPSSETPGFKVPRQIQAEILSIDGAALARQIRPTLTDAELRVSYDGRKDEFAIPSELPAEIFKDGADLTPVLYQSFDEVKDGLANSLAEEKAQADISAKFTALKDEVLIPFADKYQEAIDEIKDAQKNGETPTTTLPKPADLEPVAKKAGLNYEKSPLLDREQAGRYGQVANAELGLSPLSGGRKFADEMFDARNALYEPMEFTDADRRRFLVLKTQDNPPRVPTLDEVKAEVTLAWKSEQARPLAQKAADELAEKLRKAGGKVEGATFEGRPVVVTGAVPKLQPGLPIPGQFLDAGAPTPSTILELPDPSPTLRDDYFALEPGKVAIGWNAPKTIAYVLTLDRRTPAAFSDLFGRVSSYAVYQREAMNEAARVAGETFMAKLRKDAGLPDDWVPEDEADRANSASQTASL
ncbi:hypothetical protein EP7_003287 [Isosphaeraceae bacterium EP7]